MKYISLTPSAKPVDWARTLVTQLTQRDADLNAGRIQFDGLPGPYASDAAAGIGGVSSGYPYIRSDGSGGFYLMVKA